MAGTKERRLGAVRAVWNAFFGVEVSHYPRIVGAEKEVRLLEKNIIAEIGTELADVKFPSATDALKQARESLDEVKALTEYEDQKATRVLTIATIFGALAALMFTRIADVYPIRTIVAEFGLWSAQAILVLANYFLFLAFIIVEVSGTLVIFHATSIRFKYPLLRLDSGNLSSAKSLLFYKEIIQVSPKSWARAFLSNATPPEPRPDLSLDYFKNYIVESYLVAAKVADKLRYLMPAQAILGWAIRILLIWILVGAATFALVPEVKPVPQPIAVILRAQPPGVVTQVVAMPVPKGSLKQFAPRRGGVGATNRPAPPKKSGGQL